MNDCGFQPKMVATEQIESGALKNYKVFFMPFSQSLTEKEAAEIKKFVKNGGMLIADYACGIRDANGNLRPNGGALDDVFGIKQLDRKGKSQSLVISEMFRIPGKGGMTLACAVDETTTGGKIKLLKKNPIAKGGKNGTLPQVYSSAVGSAKDGSPVLVSSFYGKGIAFYLNFSLEPYLRLRRTGKDLPLREMFMEILLTASELTPPAEIIGNETGVSVTRAYKSLPERGVETTVFRDGGNEYIGMIWDYKCQDWKKHGVNISFTAPAHIYDVLTGKYLGFTDKVKTSAAACSVKLYARLPYKVESLEVAAPETGKSRKADSHQGGNQSLRRPDSRTSCHPPGSHRAGWQKA